MKKKPQTIDVLSHQLVPEMKVLSEHEKTQVLNKYRTDLSQLPVMLKNDPEALSLNAKPGDLVRITRNDKTGKYYAYRVIVAE